MEYGPVKGQVDLRKDGVPYTLQTAVSRSKRSANNVAPNYGSESERILRRRDTVECLDTETPFLQRPTGATVCANPCCLRDPNHFEIVSVKNRFDLKCLTRVPALLKRCDVHTMRLTYEHNSEPEYRVRREYRFAVSHVFAEAILPSHLYTSVWDERSKRRLPQTVFPRTSDDLPPDLLVGDKLRVSCDSYSALLGFCRFSIHTHVGESGVVCCKRLCCRPEPLNANELSAVKTVAKSEPYYTCSWVEKQLLFKWHLGREQFEPYLSFDFAIGAYNDLYNRFDVGTLKLFAFKCWKIPDERLSNADEVYFRSPNNLAGYKWYEPTAARTDRESDVMCNSVAAADHISDLVLKQILNLTKPPDEGVLLSETLVFSITFDRGRQYHGVD